MHLPQNSGGDFTPPPEGTHRAVCYRVVDLGTQQTEYQGRIKHNRKVMLSWELSDELMDDGKPFSINQRYTFSSHEKSVLRQHLEAWRGKRFEESDFGPGGFDIKNLIGVPCLLTILHAHKDGKTYANVQSISKLPKGMEKPAMINGGLYFTLDGRLDRTVFEMLSEGLRSVIMKSPEYAVSAGIQQPPMGDEPPPPSPDDYGVPSDDIPF